MLGRIRIKLLPSCAAIAMDTILSPNSWTVKDVIDKDYAKFATIGIPVKTNHRMPVSLSEASSC